MSTVVFSLQGQLSGGSWGYPIGRLPSKTCYSSSLYTAYQYKVVKQDRYIDRHQADWHFDQLCTVYF